MYSGVPCVVQTLTHPDEIDVHAPRAVKRNPDFYLTEPLKANQAAMLSGTRRCEITDRNHHVR